MPEPIDQANGGQPSNPADNGGQANGGQSGGQGQPGGAAPQVFEVDGVKYTPDQIKEFATRSGDYDRLNGEFTRKSQLLSDPDKLIEFARSQWPEKFPAQPAATPSQEEQEKQQAIQLLQSLGVVTKDQAEVMAQKKVEEVMAQREADQFVASEIGRLSKEWDGKDGKPKFDPKEILPYAAKEGLLPEDAFWKLKRPELLEWHSSQKPKPNAPVVAAPGGGSAPVASPKKVRFDDSSFNEAFAEHMGQG
jgi:hypothetical protein